MACLFTRHEFQPIVTELFNNTSCLVCTMTTTEKQVSAETKTTSKDAEYEFDYRMITNTSPKVMEGLQRIGVKLDAEFRAKEEEQARKAKAKA